MRQLVFILAHDFNIENEMKLQSHNIILTSFMSEFPLQCINSDMCAWGYKPLIYTPVMVFE